MNSITIQENEKPELKTCEMNCDSGLHKKLDRYELSRFLNCHSTNLLIGRPGSGKTSLLYSLFKSKELFKKVFHSVFLFQPSHVARCLGHYRCDGGGFTERWHVAQPHRHLRSDHLAHSRHRVCHSQQSLRRRLSPVADPVAV